MLKIDLKKEEKDLTVVLDGRLDTTAAPEAEEMLRRELPDCESLTVDMENLEYISSAGLRVLMFAKRELKKQGCDEMKLIHVNEIIMEIFEITGFSDIFEIETE
ncbi:MAG: STAS domain-containing protein [Lachnospiraceae bacterium]|nr:STAS domain-containing protein [Lachnospiraceae bacterium]